jgi:hypothetical protein
MRLPWLRGWLTGAAQLLPRRTFRPRVEELEDRHVPALLPGNEFLADPILSAPVSASLCAAADGHFLFT